MERALSAGFYERVYDLVRQVPAGRVSTYGDLAGLLGSRRVARQVGYALAALSDPTVPWHRIINAQGRISFKGDTDRALAQRRLLEAEGVAFDGADRVDLAALRWTFPDLDAAELLGPP